MTYYFKEGIGIIVNLSYPNGINIKKKKLRTIETTILSTSSVPLKMTLFRRTTRNRLKMGKVMIKRSVCPHFGNTNDKPSLLESLDPKNVCLTSKL